MTLFIVTPETVLNPDALRFRSAPRKLVNRIFLMPRRSAGWDVVFRVVLENQVLRYAVALLPFVLALFLWPNLAPHISQAPLAMFVAIAIVELRVLHIPRDKRARVTSEADAARSLDMLAFRGRQILSEIAARRDLREGELMLVVDQSELARVPPLTVVTVQLGYGKERLVPLDTHERALIRDMLFDDDLTERDLHKANQREDLFIRTVAYDARAVTGHARLEALLNTGSPA